MKIINKLKVMVNQGAKKAKEGIATLRNKIQNGITTARAKLAVKSANMQAELAGETGANTHTDVTIWIVIGVTLGAIALAALIYIFRDVVMEKVEEMINSMFGNANNPNP